MSFTRRLRRNLEREGKIRREVLMSNSRKKIEEFLQKYPKATITYVPRSSAGCRKWNARCVGRMKWNARCVAWVKT